MYLSRIPLDTSRRKTQAALLSPSKIHGAVEEAFSEKHSRKLWRIDTLRGETYLLILSASKPDLQSIAVQFGYRDAVGESKEYERLLERICEDSVWQFRLVANPTRSVSQESGRGKIQAYLLRDDQMKWLVRQAEKRGFSVYTDTLRILDPVWKSFQKRSDDHKYKVHIFQVTFEGYLKVEDAGLFKKTLIEGVGRGKAYGMGLLTVAGRRRQVCRSERV